MWGGGVFPKWLKLYSFLNFVCYYDRYCSLVFYLYSNWNMMLLSSHRMWLNKNLGVFEMQEITDEVNETREYCSGFAEMMKPLPNCDPAQSWYFLHCKTITSKSFLPKHHEVPLIKCQVLDMWQASAFSCKQNTKVNFVLIWWCSVLEATLGKNVIDVGFIFIL